MPVQTLVQLAQKACIRNIRGMNETSNHSVSSLTLPAITDLGDAPYELFKPVLVKVETPEQLVSLLTPLLPTSALTPQHELETNSPQLLGHTADLWRAMIKRDVGKLDPPEPSDPASWYRVYRKLLRADQKATERQEAQLASQMQGIRNAAAERTSRIVDAKSLPRLNKALGGREPKKASTRFSTTADPSTLRFTSGSRTKMLTGQDVMNRARREAREMSLRSAQGRSALARPAHHAGIPSRFNQPLTVPKSMIGDHQRQLKLAVPRRSSTAGAPKPASSAPAANPLPKVRIHHASAEKRPSPTSPEKRPAAPAPKKRPASDDEDDDGLDDLFSDDNGDLPASPPRLSPSPQPRLSQVPRLLAPRSPDRRPRDASPARPPPRENSPPAGLPPRPAKAPSSIFLQKKKRKV